MEKGELLRTIRVPIAPGATGKIYSVAISPDGRLIAAGGFTHFSRAKNQPIYIFDRASGELVNRIDGLPNVTNDLEYSPDGRFLAAALGGKNGLRVFETDSFSEVARDTDYGTRSYGVAFAADGRMATTSWDGFIRLYDSQYQLVAKEHGRGGDRPFGVAFSPDGREIAVGLKDTGAVEIYSASDLSLLYAPRSGGANIGNLSSLDWSLDGTRLCAGGQYDDGSGLNPIRCWGDRGRGDFEDHTLGNHTTIVDTKPLRDGAFAVGAGAGKSHNARQCRADHTCFPWQLRFIPVLHFVCEFKDPFLGVIDNKGGVLWSKQGVIADFRDQVGNNAMRVSETGDVVDFHFEIRGDKPARFSLRDGTLTLDPPPMDGLVGPQTEASGLDIQDWKGYEPKLNGKRLGLSNYEKSNALAIAPDEERFVLGAYWNLRAFDRDGEQVWKVVTDAFVWSVTVSRDGRTVIAGVSDGTIRWHAMDDGRLLLSLFTHPEDQRWIAWTPDG